MVVSSRKVKFVLLASVLLAVIALGVVGVGVVRANSLAPVPKCSEPELQPSGNYLVVCKPGDGATIARARVQNINNIPGSFITLQFIPEGARIEFNDPDGACYRWQVRDTNLNVNNYTRGYPNLVAGGC